MSLVVRRAILVLGMHRSGTSAMSGLLRIFGIELGRDLMEPNEFNVKGYFENKKVYSLNEDILRTLGVNWHSSYLLPSGWQNAPVSEDLVLKISEFLECNFLEDSFFCIKDPRLAILLPLWQRALDRVGIAYKVIIMLRHPSEVAMSLLRPHPTIAHKSSLLWIDYNFRIEIQTRQCTRLFVEFDSLLYRTSDVLLAIVGFLGESLVINDRLLQEANEFLESRLKHHSSIEPQGDESFSTSQELWSLLREVVKSDTKQVHKQLDRFYLKHSDSLAIYSKVFTGSQDEQLQVLSNENAKLSRQLEKSQRKVEDLNLREIALSNEIEEKEALIQKQITLLVEQENKIYQKRKFLEEAYEAVRFERFDKVKRLNDMGAVLKEKIELLKILQDRLTGVQNHAGNLKRDYDNLRMSISFRLGWLLTRPFSVFLGPSSIAGLLPRAIHILPQLLLNIFRYPLKSLRHLNVNNFRILKNALMKEEHPKQIIANLRSLFEGRKQIIHGQNEVTPHLDQYQIFVEKHRLTSEDRRRIQGELGSFIYKPLISIVTPVFNTDPEYLDRCIDSVLHQFYQNWELCLHDDCSTSTETKKCLEKWQVRDSRIKISFGSINRHISAASNEAIKLARGEFVGFLDHDDELTEDALFEIVKYLNLDSTLDLIYSDEDKLDTNGLLCDPHFKSDFNLDLLLSHNYICHFVSIRKTLGDEIGWFREGLEGAQDYDLFLRLIERTNKIHHIPKVLYHWRKAPQSTASKSANKEYSINASEKALVDYLDRNNIVGKVLPGLFHGSWRIKREVLNPEELVSIIIPFKDQVNLLRQCINSILEKTIYRKYEIILVSNNSSEQDTFEYLTTIVNKFENIYTYEYNIPFNFSKINNWAVTKANGTVLLFLNNDTAVITPGWLTAMLEHAQREEVGAVGAKLLYANGSIQHAGVVVGIGGVAGHIHNNYPNTSLGYFGRTSILQNLSACTGACLMVKKSVFNAIGGFEEEGLKIAFNDIDLCLRIRKMGYLIVFTPYSELFHYESISRGYEDTPEKKHRFGSEVLFFKKRWIDVMKKGDPYYNPNLTLETTDFSLCL